MSPVTRRGALSLISASGAALAAPVALAALPAAGLDAELFRLADAYFAAKALDDAADAEWSARYHARPKPMLPPKPARAEFPTDLLEAMQDMRLKDWRDPNHPTSKRMAEFEATHKAELAAWQAECDALRSPADHELTALCDASNDANGLAVDAYYAALNCPAQTVAGARLKARLLDEPFGPDEDDFRAIVAELVAFLPQAGEAQS